MTAIGLSHGGTSTSTSSSPAHRLLVGTAGGVFIFERAGVRGDWRMLRRALVDRHVSALLVPAPDLIVAGATTPST
jgi:hypothetical protein